MFNRFYSKLTILTVGGVFGIFTSQAPATAAFFRGVGDLLGGGLSSAANRVSGDGSVVGGISFSEAGPEGEAFLWTVENGIRPLGFLAGGENGPSGVFGISDDGLVAAGASFSPESALSVPPLQSFRWTAETGLVPLGDLPGGAFSSFTLNISGDGSVVVGSGESASGTEAFRWTEETGMVGLGDLAGGAFFSTATNASFDGSVVVGNSISSTGPEGFRWTEETGLVGLGDLAGGEILSNATSISNDGLVIVGASSSDNSVDSGGTEAFRWTAENGMVGLGDLAGGNFFSVALAVSGDGSIIVGQSESSRGEEPFIWDSLNGMRSLIQLLANDFSLDVSDWTNLTVADISADGSTIVGVGNNPEGALEGWVANLDSEQTQVPEATPVLGLFSLLGVLGANVLLKRFREYRI
ncbi:MAG: PEP-CTERM sorting domain-containing protein [Moorea sp. SIO4A1]|uniref:PEP-CTERM sorting domain-containing protein n=1 Tax=Moorena sp. SIO4A1 TaxID=2607835 RepID=UPI00144CA185|nr:PEP-CTERM sorting domain-containing protein [Moorena sp. SIO4A1]NEQ62731.1 PEP-CTERM sorting domain-containing protein [Moorena sp. SIO4A1]